MPFRIEIGRDLAACDEAVELQKAIWGEALVVPSNLLLAAVHVGGFLALAYVDERAVGFVFSFYGIRDWRFCHHSHMLAVLPEHRGGEMARALKAAQRDHCLEQGLELVTWTMDPLESRNARFNMAKLGAFGAEYREDFYGEMPDKLNQGSPSDRFIVEWPIATDHVAKRLGDVETAPALVDAERDVPWLLRSDGDRPAAEGSLGEKHLLVAAPWDFQSLKSREPDLALTWRHAHRRTLGKALAEGYAAVDYLIDEERRRGAYLLVKRPRARPPGGAAAPTPGGDA